MVTFVNNKFTDWKVGDQIRFNKVIRNKYNYNALSFDICSSFELNKNAELVEWFKNWKNSNTVKQNCLADILNSDRQLRITNQATIVVNSFKGHIKAVKLLRQYEVCNNCLKTLYKKEEDNCIKKYCENCKKFCGKPLRRDVSEMQLFDNSAEVFVTYFVPFNNKHTFEPDDEYEFRIRASMSNVNCLYLMVLKLNFSLINYS